MKALVGAFNQEKALVGAISMIVKTGCGTDGSSCGTNCGPDMMVLSCDILTANYSGPQHTCTGANQLEDTFLTFMSDAWMFLTKCPKTYRGTTIQHLYNEYKYKLKLIGLIVCVVYTFYKSNSEEYNRQGDLKTEISHYEWCRWYCFWGPPLPVESNEKSNGLPRPGPGGSSAG